MTAPDYDLVVVGGGILGAGVAQAGAAAGYDVLLLEQRHLAAGTSSRSSKLVHGGLRYLESFQLGLVRESLREREILLRNAPDLVRLVPFTIPVYRDTSRRPWQIRAGLGLYALLGGLGEHARFAGVARAEWERLDGLRTDGLEAVFRYHDGQTDDAALTRAVVRSAQELGARLACPAAFLAAERVGRGYRVRCREGDAERELLTTALVNAAGPWVEQVRARIRPEPPGMRVDLVQGAHVELRGRLERGVYYTEARRDRRAVLTMPWKGHTLVGTTESLHLGDPDGARPLEREVEYLLETFAHYFPGRETKVLDAWAGLRVLPAAGGSLFRRRRDTHFLPDDRTAPHLVGLYGGKLTGYRATASNALRILRRTLPPRRALADTRFVRLVGDQADAPLPAAARAPERTGS